MTWAQVPPQTLERWMDEHGSRVRAIAEAFAEGAVEPEDIFLETFILAWKEGGPLLAEEDGRGVGAWLCNVAANIGRSARETGKRRRRLLTLWAGAPSRPQPPRSIAEEMYIRQLWRAVGTLPARQRSVLLRRTVGGATTREVAEELGITDGTVRATLRDAVRAVRNKLAPHDEGDDAAM